MVCIRCERDRDVAPWIVFDRSTGKLFAYCPDCALAVVEERMKEREASAKKVNEN